MLSKYLPSPTYKNPDILQKAQQFEDASVEISPIKTQVVETIKELSKAFSNYEKKELLEALSITYAENAFLNDRIHSVSGKKAILDYFEGTFEKIQQAEFRFLDSAYETKGVYVRWVMRLQFRENQEFFEFLGVSHLRFNKEAKIIYHQDFWDFSELMAEIRFLKTFVNLAKSNA